MTGLHGVCPRTAPSRQRAQQSQGQAGWPLLAAFAGIAMGVLTWQLGQWQTHRALSKEQAELALAHQALAPAWQQADWPCVLDQGQDLSHDARWPIGRRVRLRGQWLSSRTVLLDNRQLDGAAGWIVVTPLRLAPSGRCGPSLVLVQRAWLPRNVLQRSAVPNWADDPGQVEVQGILAAQVSRTYDLGQEAAPAVGAQRVQRQNVDAKFWQSWSGQRPLAGVLLQTLTEHAEQAKVTQVTQVTQVSQATADALPGLASLPGVQRHWPSPGLGAPRHRAYALQWYLLSALSLGLTMVLSWRHWRQQRQQRQPAQGSD